MDRSLIIVSNGAVERPHGEQIDAFDEVCRINSGPTVGFEHLVGSRTTIWARWLGDDSKLDLHAGAARKLMWGQKQRPKETADGWEWLPHDVLDEIRGNSTISTPTTGLAAIVFLLREYPLIHLFNWFPSGAWLRHYWPDPIHRKCCNSHKPTLEREYVERLRDEGRVVLIDD